MIKVWILTVILFNGDLNMFPKDSLEDCIASSKLYTNVEYTECYQIEMFAPSSIYAPELSPVPTARP